MTRLLLIDHDKTHSERLTETLRFHRLEVETCSDPQQAILQLRKRCGDFEVVVINVSDGSFPWFVTLQKLQDVCRRSDGRSASLFLCFSRTKKSTAFILRIEHLGARYVFEP